MNELKKSKILTDNVKNSNEFENEIKSAFPGILFEYLTILK